MQLSDYTFRDETTRSVSDLRYVEYRLRREVEIVGILEGFPGLAEFRAEVAALDAAVEAFAVDGAEFLRLPGRYLPGRVLRYRKTVDEAARVASFRLVLLSDDRFERSTTLHTVTLEFSASGQSVDVDNAGTAASLPALTLTAGADLVTPSISDGTRTLMYGGTLTAGESLVLDCDAHTAECAGENALPLLSGDWPQLAPGATTLTYTDAGGASGSLRIDYRDFWA